MERPLDLSERMGQVHDRIRKAAEKAGRDPETVRLVAVSKTVSADRVRQAIEAGAAILGESYIQEAQEKIAALSQIPVSWHFIGHLQTNKAKYAVRIFDLIHSVDSVKLASEIDAQAERIGKIQPVLIQVNIAKEKSKSGIPAAEALSLVREAAAMKCLQIRGLMTIPPFFDDPEKSRPVFSALRKLRDRIRGEAISRVSMEELSMGMTADFEAAIAEGATLVRIGTAIFGERA